MFEAISGVIALKKHTKGAAYETNVSGKGNNVNIISAITYLTDRPEYAVACGNTSGAK